MKKAIPTFMSNSFSRWKESDRIWFEQHPESVVRIRPIEDQEIELMVLEFGPRYEGVIRAVDDMYRDHVGKKPKKVFAVVQIEPGRRMKFVGVQFERRQKVLFRFFFPWADETIPFEQKEARFIEIRKIVLETTDLNAAHEDMKQRQSEGDICRLCGDPFLEIDIVWQISFDHDAPRPVCKLCGANLGDIAQARPVAVIGISVYLSGAVSDALSGTNPDPDLVKKVQNTTEAAQEFLKRMTGSS